MDLFRYPLCAPGAQAAPLCYMSVASGFAPAPQLLRSLDAGYLEPVGPPGPVARVVSTTFDGPPLSWPRWEFDDVEVSAAAADPPGTYYFAVRVPGVESHTTIWAHGADPRTNFPQRDVSTSGGAGC